MKRLIYMRHGHKTPDNHITEETKLLIREQADRIDSRYTLTQVFWGELIRTQETASEVLDGIGFSNFSRDPNGQRPGIGNDQMFGKMINAAFKEGVKAGKSNFEALRAAHPEAIFMAWCVEALEAIKSIFNELEDVEDVGLVCGHSPIIEMAAFAANCFEFADPSFASLKEVEALVFRQDDNGVITVIKKFDQSKLEEAAAQS